MRLRYPPSCGGVGAVVTVEGRNNISGYALRTMPVDWRIS